jgi:uncharacterized protein YfaS (alpha-2-macroglobulin family)
MNGPRVGALGLILFAAVSGASDARRVVAGAGAVPEEPAVAREPEGLRFRLSEGAEAVEGPLVIARPPASPLDDAATQHVLDRLPPWTKKEEETPFALREDSLPPPRTGRTVRTAFPPPEAAERPEREAGGPIEVVRHQPEGEVPLAPHLSVTFSAPMVAATSHGDLARETPPVRLAPEPPGEWRWVGTRTVLFEPEGRFPMATEYRVEVPAGTGAAGGGTLTKGVAWGFSTPPPRVVQRHPENGPERRDTLLFAAFDQRIDPEAVLDTARVRAEGTEVPVRLAGADEVEADETVRGLAERSEDGRWLAFRTERPLPPDSAITVTVGPGTPSAEGPRVTTEAQEWSFRTYGPFRVRKHECGWGRGCAPHDVWRILFTNPVDAKAFRPDMVRADPPVPSLQATAQGESLVLHGAKAGRTRYEVTVSAEIRDVFGQALEDGPPLRFDVGPAEEALFAPGGEFVVLDPAGGARFPVYSINHPELRVEAWAVEPEDWPAWHAYRRDSWRNQKATPPGRRVLETTVKTARRSDELVETRLDLSPALEGGLGQLVLLVRPVKSTKKTRGQEVRAWVQSTRLGLDAFEDGQTLVAWVTALADGRPLADVEVSLGSGRSVRTNEAGLARVDLTETPAPLLVTRWGGDVAILPEQSSWWTEGAGWQRRERRDALRFCVFDDRQMYRPGEEVRVKGWVRHVGAGPHGDVGPLPPETTELDWTLSDSRGNEVADGTARLGAFGGFDLTLTLPPTMNLGTAALKLEARAAGTGPTLDVHRFEVQEFRRPEFEVTATASEGPHVVGGHAVATVSAAYYAGGALPGAEVSWRVAATPGTYRPPHWDDFVFGTFVPWWHPRPEPSEPERVEAFAARTDGVGVHRLRIDFESGDPPRPRHLSAEATVEDVNRQAWTADVDLLVHPSELYVGLRGERAFVQKGEAIPVDVIAADLDGQAMPGRTVRLRAERLDWAQVEGEWQLVPEDVQEREVDSGAEPVRVEFEGREGGSWRVLARTADDRGRLNETELRVWVAGGGPPPRRLDQQDVTLVPDRKEYGPGDVARVLVLAPFAPAQGVLTLRRSGLLREESFAVSEGSHTLEIPIEESWTPNVHVQVDLVGSAPRDESKDAPERPAFARGALDLPIPPVSRQLTVEVTPRDAALAPGGETVLDLALRDDDGRPVSGGEMAVVVVDEAVLALTGYRVPDPVDVFYARRAPEVDDHHLRAHVQLAAPEDLSAAVEGGVAGGVPGGVLGADLEGAMLMEAAPPPAPMAARAMGLGKAAPEPIAMRTDFSALALFVPGVVAGDDGRAEVPVRLPDSLTRYRVMAVAAEGGRRFGAGEATLVARLPLMVRPSPPRFLNFGDRFELPVVVQNQTDGEMTVDVAVRARNATLLEGAGRRLVVAANDRAEVRFPTAAARAGTALFQVGAAAGSVADAAELSLPVWTPATTEAFATYGQVDSGVIAQPVTAPEGVVPQFGGLEVTTSSTALQALTDAVLYLVAYPFECAEQLSSRVLAIAALRDVLAAFEAEGLPPPDELREAVERDVERLQALQNRDGGFAFWRRGDRSWPYVSIHAAHALVRAQEKGFAVPEAVLGRSRAYLGTVEKRIPSDYPPAVRRTLVAYALHVRNLMGEAQPERARALVEAEGVGELTFEALGWILPTLSRDPAVVRERDEVRRRLANGVTETAAAAHFAVSYTDGAHLLLHSNRRADAVVLEALIADQPQNDLIPKLVAGLLAHRRAGRWANTQENVFILLALDRYFQAYEKETPDFVARAWLGERFAGEHAFRGHTTESHHVRIPMRALSEAREGDDLLLAKDGPGRLYYRIGLRYAPEGLRLEPLDRGFTVERTYEAVDDDGDVRRDDDGIWRIRAGARVRVRLSMVAPTRRYHVALVDPLPAGLEAQNPALATTGALPGAGGDEVTPYGAPGLGGPGFPGHWWWWSRPWFEHQNLRDERVEAFSSLVWEGVYTYRYVARATTPGTFIVPPPKAEEMYAPETFGRGPTDVLVVE